MKTKDEYKDLPQNLGKRIKEMRQLKHMTGDKFSEMVGISSTFLWDLENGSKRPSVDTLVKIANILECSLDSLLCDCLEKSTVPQLNNISKKLDKLDKHQLRLVELTIDSMLNAFKDV
ncbi:MAG: helix-turn-helix domain-containing protein [Clostridia bacterium]